MKTIHDSNKKHWAIGHQILCDRCDTIYEVETIFDFYDQYGSRTIKTTCPNCNKIQETYKPKKAHSLYGSSTTAN